MSLRIRLSDADRERLGCPEWIVFDASTVTIRQLAEVEQVTGMRPAAFQAGLTEATPSAEHLWVRVWLALRTAGVDVALADFDFAVGSCQAERTADETEDGQGKGQGKDPSTPPTRTPRSKRSSPGTRSRSRT